MSRPQSGTRPRTDTSTSITRRIRREWRWRHRARARASVGASPRRKQSMTRKPNAAKMISAVNQSIRTPKRKGCRNTRVIASDSIPVTRAHGGRQRLQVEPRQEIDRLEVPVQRRRAADLRAEVQVGAEE